MINRTIYDFSLLTFEERIIVNGILILLQHIFQIFRIHFPKYDFEYYYLKFINNNKNKKKNKSI